MDRRREGDLFLGNESTPYTTDPQDASCTSHLRRSPSGVLCAAGQNSGARPERPDLRQTDRASPDLGNELESQQMHHEQARQIHVSSGIVIVAATISLPHLMYLVTMS